MQYADIFANSKSDLGRTNLVKHRIYTGEAPPIRQAPRRVPPHHKQDLQELLNGMLKDDVIQPSLGFPHSTGQEGW